MDDANELKSILRSLLISNPRKTRASFLKKDFKENYGKEFPYNAFGFNSFLDYLMSIPDVVQVEDFRNPDPVVLPVTSEKSLHVESLIGRQRVDNKKTRSGRGPPPRRPPAIPCKYFLPNPVCQKNLPQQKLPSLFDAPLYNPTDIHCKPQENFNVNTIYSNTASNSKYSVVPEFVCQKVKNMVDKNPSGITLYDMSREIFLKDDYKIPLAIHGVNNVMQLLDNCSDFVTINGNVVFPKYVKRKTDNKYTNIYPAGIEEECLSSDDILSQKMEFGVDSDDNVAECSQKGSNRSTPSSKAYSDIIDDEDELGAKIISNFRKLLDIYTDGIWCAQLPNYYFKEFRVPLDVREWNYSSVIQMASRLPNVFHYVREGSSDWKLFDARLKSNFSSDNCDRDKSNLLERKWIPQSVLENIQKLLAQYPTGLETSTFIQKYSEKYNSNLQDLGFQSFNAFLEAVGSVVHLREAYNKLFLLPKKVKRTEEDELPVPSVPALPEFQKLIPQLYPKEVCGPDFVLPLYNLQNKRVPFILQVRVTEVSHPGCFWMVSELMLDDLEVMMSDLNDFYNHQTEDNELYLMPESTLFKGQLCAAVYGIDNKWHRAKILHYFSFEDKVKIEYIDFGTISIVPKSMLRFLHKDFTALPQLSVKGKLYGIECLAAKWSKESGHQLLELVSGRSLLAEVCVCKPEEPYIEMILYEAGPDGAKQMLINSFFVNMGMARFIEEKEDRTEVSPVESVTSKSNAENNTLCMKPPLRPPPGFTEKDICPSNSYPYFDVRSTVTPPFEVNTMGMFAQSEANNLLIESFSKGIQTELPPLNYNKPVLSDSTYNQPSPYQVTINHTYQPSNSDQLLQLLTSFVQVQKSNLTNTNESMLTEADVIRLSPPFQASQVVTDTQNVPIITEHPLSMCPEYTCNVNTPSNSKCERLKKSQRNNCEFNQDKNRCTTCQVTKKSSKHTKTQTGNVSELKKVKERWSPVEIDKNLSNKSRQELEVKSPERTCKTPESWEDILVEAFNEKFKLLETSSELSLPGENMMNNKTVDTFKPISSEPALPVKNKTVDTFRPVNDKTNSRTIKRDSILVIPPIFNKESWSCNEVTICLQNIIIDEPEKKKCLLKEIEIGLETLHIMNVNDSVMVSSEEVIKKFTPYSDRNVVMKILNSKRINFPFSDVYRVKNQPLFETVGKTELLALNLKSGVSLTKMNVVPLDAVPYLLSALNIKDKNVLADFSKAVCDFKDSGHW